MKMNDAMIRTPCAMTMASSPLIKNEQQDKYDEEHNIVVGEVHGDGGWRMLMLMLLMMMMLMYWGALRPPTIVGAKAA
jgi:hypothetical protein